MYLSKLKIKNFRAIKDLEIEFKEGVTILVGENNAGKTTIIDALRAIMIPAGGYGSYRLTVDDFRDGDTSSNIELKASIQGMNEDDEIVLFNSLVFDNQGSIWSQYNLSSMYDETRGRIKTQLSVGHELSNNPPRGIYDYIDVTYLRPLRDPSTSLSEGRYSCQAQYISNKLEGKEDEQKKLIDAVRTINEVLLTVGDVEEIKDKCNEELKKIVGENMAQYISFAFNEPSFLQLVADVKTIINDKHYRLNGLGFNNLIEIAIIMASKSFDKDGYHLLLIEEPEAHLHPILQRLLLAYIQEVARRKKSNVQVIITTHSPTLASKADISNVCHVSKYGDLVTISPLFNFVNEEATDDDVSFMNRKKKRKLERYLDSTRGELFFSRKVILVEGIAEAILLPVIASLSNRDLDKCRVTIINCEGLNFDIFIPLLNRLNIKTAVLTDSDCEDVGACSEACDRISTMVGKCHPVSVFVTLKSLEYALSKSDKIALIMAEIFEEMNRPIYAKRCREGKCSELYSTAFKSGVVSKGVFAQELVEKLESLENHKKREIYESFPASILETLEYICDE